MNPSLVRQWRQRLLENAIHGPLPLEQIIVAELCEQLAETQDTLVRHLTDHPQQANP